MAIKTLVLHSVIVIGSINFRTYVLGSKVSDVKNLVLVQEKAIVNEDLTKKMGKIT